MSHNGSDCGSILRRTPLARQSKKRARQERDYLRLRAAFLQGRPVCEFPEGCHAPATEVHHKRGRTGSLYLDVTWWAPLCHDHHAWVTGHPAAAIALGISAPRIGHAAGEVA